MFTLAVDAGSARTHNTLSEAGIDVTLKGDGEKSPEPSALDSVAAPKLTTVRVGVPVSNAQAPSPLAFVARTRTR